jgi:hypothetical protein
MVDSEGHVVWYGRTDVAPQGATRRANGNWVVLSDSLTEFSALGSVVNHLAPSQVAAGETIHHGITATPWDTLLFLVFEPRTFDGQEIQGEALIEWEPRTGALMRRWSAFDFFDPSTDRGPRSVPSDWFHANSVAFGPRGNVLVSFHFLDQVISIAPDFGSIEWRLGGVGSTLNVAADQATSGQHSAREVATNSVLVFDNGFARADGTKFSRVIEFGIDPTTGSVQTIWEYRPSPVIWSTIISSARRLGNGNTLATFGTPAGLVQATGPIAVHEVSPAGELVWSMVVTLPSGSVFQGDALDSIGGEKVAR